MKITIGIQTFNRLPLLQKMAKSLYLSSGIEECNVRIYDDASTEFGINELKKIFPRAKEIIIHPKNLGKPDFNMRTVYENFLKSKDDFLVCADSDLIFNPEWLEKIKKLISSTDGILSLYNSVNHQEIKSEINISGEKIIVKNSIGNAGTCFSRKVIEEIVKNVPPSDTYDWDWSKYLNKNLCRLCCTKNSYIQHIGYSGANCNTNVIDYGVNFLPGNNFNYEENLSLFENIISDQKARIVGLLNLENELKRISILSRVAYKLLWALSWPFRKLWKAYNS